MKRIALIFALALAVLPKVERGSSSTVHLMYERKL